MQNKTLVVIGMHRSGTSLITKWLLHCGLEVGESLLGPGLGNSGGHFEDTEFYKIHLEILRDNNLHDSGIVIDPRYNLTPYHQEKIKGIIAVKNRLFEQWAWKDPRTCLFLDFYTKILPDAYYLVAIRDYQAVVVSLLKRTFAERDIAYLTKKGFFRRLFWQKFKRKKQFEKFCREKASFFLKVWIQYNEKILDALKTIPVEKYLVINYLELKKKDEAIMAYLSSNWHFKLKYTRFLDIYNENLFSKAFSVERYIDEKQLVITAQNLYSHLNAFVANQNEKVVYA
jgi:hypothetical protein